MIRPITLAMLVGVALASAQESPSPTTSPTATATPTASPARSVRISFVPPPLDGTISLGIYDREGKLVRVLVDQGAIDEFDVGADALNAKWDGKNDSEEDSPAGKYHARGYMVGALKVEDMGPATTPMPLDLNNRVQVKLVSNPLSKDAKTIVDLAASFEDDQIVLKSADGLPLFTVIEAGRGCACFREEKR